MAFTGIPAEAFDFYDALAADNSKTFWTEHRAEYDQYVRQPLTELAGELEPEFGAAHLFRPYRDVRFSKDKSPLKDHQGLYVELRNGLGWYAQVSATGLMLAGGWYSSTPSQVARYRAAVETDEPGELSQLVTSAASAGLTVSGETLKTRPRGIPPDHPRIELLRHRTLYVYRTWEPQAWMGTRRAVTRVRRTWRDITPLMEWLSDRVGPNDG